MKLKAPWTAKQVEALNKFQKLGHIHEFTCPNSHPKRALTARPEGWLCIFCGYTQDWAHDFMCDETQHPKPPFPVKP